MGELAPSANLLYQEIFCPLNTIRVACGQGLGPGIGGWSVGFPRKANGATGAHRVCYVTSACLLSILLGSQFSSIDLYVYFYASTIPF